MTFFIIVGIIKVIIKEVVITKKTVSAILSAIILISLVVECFAASTPVIVTEYFEEYCDDYGEAIVVDGEYVNASEYFFSNAISGKKYSSYSLLNDLERVFYDKVLSLDVGVLSFTISYSPALTKVQYESIDFTKIMYAICLDHPEIFYYNGYGVSRSYYPSTGAVTKISYQIGIKKHGQTNAEIYSASNIKSNYNAMMQVINNTQFNTTTRYDFVKSVHDYLCNNITYINDYASCHDAYGALVNGEAVCQGYAETFKIFCDKYKVPCVCVTGSANGGAHMWNAIQMEDGKWYLVDATWDDQDSYGIFTDFFLIGLKTKDKYFTGEAFELSHVSDGSPYLPALEYADTAFISSNKYSKFTATTNARADFSDRKLVLSYFDGSDNEIYFHGMYAPVSGYYTTATFTAPSGKSNAIENWRLVLVGDCNGDGASNSSDYNAVVNKALNGEAVADDFDEACDADSDGVIDVLDVAILERAIGGSNTKIDVNN